MVKKVLSLVVFSVLLTGYAQARDNCGHPYFKDIYNACQPDRYEPDTDTTVEHHETFDWGAYGNVILWETKNTEWGVLSTFAYETNETRVYAGGKIYLNRMFWQKKEQTTPSFLQ